MFHVAAVYRFNTLPHAWQYHFRTRSHTKASWPGPLTAWCQARNGTEVTSQPADHALVAVHDAKNIATDRDFHSSEGHWDDDDVLIIYSYCSCAVAMKVTEADLHSSQKNSAVLALTKVCWYLNLTDWCQEIVPAWQEKQKQKQSSWLSRTFFKNTHTTIHAEKCRAPFCR